MSSPPRVVIDTNLVLSALVFTQGNTAMLRQSWQGTQCKPLISTATAAELIRVLAYRKFKLTAEDQQELLADYLPFCTPIHAVAKLPTTPPCRDPFDVPFLQLALAGKADYLITGDQDLLSLAGGFHCPIITLRTFLASVAAK